ncbi:unnamed protein product [Musa acuminata subsp. burmannicoides]
MALVLGILYGIENPKQMLELLLDHHRYLLLLFRSHGACTPNESESYTIIIIICMI